MKPLTKQRRSIVKKMKHKVMLQNERKEKKNGVTYQSGINLQNFITKGKYFEILMLYKYIWLVIFTYRCIRNKICYLQYFSPVF